MLPALDNQVHGKNILLVQPFFLSLHIGMPFGTICWSWLLLVIRWAIMPFVCPIGKEALDPGLLALGALLELWESGLLHPQPALAPWGAAVDTPPKWITWTEMAKVNYGGRPWLPWSIGKVLSSGWIHIACCHHGSFSRGWWCRQTLAHGLEAKKCCPVWQ